MRHLLGLLLLLLTVISGSWCAGEDRKVNTLHTSSDLTVTGAGSHVAEQQLEWQSPPCPAPDEAILPCACNSSKNEVICRGPTDGHSGQKLSAAFQVFAARVPARSPLYHSISINLRDLVTLDANVFAGIRFSTMLLRGNNFTHIHKDAFHGTEDTVQSLYLYKTKLTNAPPEYDFFAAMRSLTNLKKLTVTHSELIEIPDRGFSAPLTNLSAQVPRELRDLVFNNGTMTSIGTDAFSDLSLLTNLALSKNRIKRIAPYAFRTSYTSNLSLIIDLTDNSLDETSFEPTSLLGAKRPIKINLGLGGCSSQLTHLPESAFKPFLDENDRNVVDVGRDCLYMQCDVRMCWTTKYNRRVKNMKCKTSSGAPVQFSEFITQNGINCDQTPSEQGRPILTKSPPKPEPPIIKSTSYSTTSSIPLTTGSSEPFCQSKKCTKQGIEMAGYLNRSVEPCESFYDFACNGWENTHLLEYLLPVLSNGGSEYDNFVNVRLKIEDNLDKLLQADGERKSSPVVIDVTHSPDEDKERHAASQLKILPFTNTRAMYSHCLAPAKGPNHEALKSILSDIGGWPLLSHSKMAPPNLTNYEWERHFVTIFNKYKDNIFVELETAVNENSTKHLMIKAGSFIVSKRKLLSVKLNRLENYANYMLATATHFGAQNSQNETMNEIWDVIRFEKQVANIAKRNVGTENMIERKLDTIGCLIPEINWLGILYDIHKYHNAALYQNESSFVQSKAMYDVHYLIDLSRLLARTDRRVIANYLGWRVVESFGFLIGGSAFVEIQQNFYSSESREGTKLIKKQCLEPITKSLPYLMARIYLDKHLPLSARRNARKIVEAVKGSFLGSMSNKTWIDESKEQLLARVQGVQVNIGYPDWILDDRKLVNHYSLLNFTRAQNESTPPEVELVRFFSKMQEIRVRHLLAHIGEQVNKSHYWDPLPLYVGASYDIVDNIISIPMGLLQPPFYEDDRPFNLNYASLGSFFGHELSHAVTPRYTEFERLLPPWTDQFLKEYLNKAQCFVTQYNSYYDKTAEQHLDGMRTFEEDMSDLAGIQAAFNAYQDQTKINKEIILRLQELPDFSTDMLFFLSFAQKWCRSNSRLQTRLKISKSVHSPEKYRVNGALSNLEAFATAFSCPAGSPMNPERKKCESW